MGKVISISEHQQSSRDHKNAQARKRYAASPEKQKVRSRKYYADNRKNCDAAARKRYARNPDKVKTIGLLIKYKLSLDQYVTMLQEQDGLCKKCGIAFSKERGIIPYVDHDHSCCPGTRSCGKCVRALLCRMCNLLVGVEEKRGIKYTVRAEYIDPPLNDTPEEV